MLGAECIRLLPGSSAEAHLGRMLIRAQNHELLLKIY